MPIYRYECECGEVAEEYRKIADRHLSPMCPTCRLEMPRGIERPNLNPDLEPYLDEHLVPQHSTAPGTYIKSRRHKAEVMIDLGVAQL